MSETDKSWVNRLVSGLKQPLFWLMLLFGAVMLVALDLLPKLGDRFADIQDVQHSEPEQALTAELVDRAVLLRWNGLVNSWRHPARSIFYETELRLSLTLRNQTNRDVEIQQLRLLTQAGDRQITWEGIWQAQAFERDIWAPFDPQIQQHRESLKPFKLEDRASALALMVDFVPLDYASELTQGSYSNRLQASLSDSDQWVELTQFDFTIPEDFELSGSHVSRYQLWQTFALDATPQVTVE